MRCVGQSTNHFLFFHQSSDIASACVIFTLFMHLKYDIGSLIGTVMDLLLGDLFYIFVCVLVIIFCYFRSFLDFRGGS